MFIFTVSSRLLGFYPLDNGVFLRFPLHGGFMFFVFLSPQNAVAV